MKRPELNEVDLSTARTGLFNGRGGLCVTMSPGQWDALLDEAYRRGALLLEIDQNEQPVRADHRKPDKSTPPTSNKRLGGNPGRRLATNFYLQYEV